LPAPATITNPAPHASCTASSRVCENSGWPRLMLMTRAPDAMAAAIVNQYLELKARGAL
jgi:hypothetical protein